MDRYYHPTNILDAAAEMERNSKALQKLAAQQQQRYFALVSNMVALQQSMREAKNYEVSDAIRTSLAVAGIRITQGTGDYTYDLIPPELTGRPTGDTWSDRQEN